MYLLSYLPSEMGVSSKILSVSPGASTSVAGVLGILFLMFRMSLNTLPQLGSPGSSLLGLQQNRLKHIYKV